jgi:hypothetical protein
LKELIAVDQPISSAEDSKIGPVVVRAIAGRITLLLVVAVLGGVFALSKLLTVFQKYDDEGYLLLSLNHYLNGSHLYTDTFTQYGPFYYFAQWIFFRVLHLPVTHDGGRLVTLVCWLISALFAGLFIQRISKSLLLGAAAGLGCVTVGAFLANEPGHPQQVLLLLWMVAVYLALPQTSGRTTLQMFLLGAIAAGLLFTKINVGVFYVAALANALVCVVKPGWIRVLGVSISILYVASVPYFLMRSNFHRGVEGYCLLAILCGTSTFALGSLIRLANPYSARTLLYAGSGLLSMSLLIVIAGWLQGISLTTLVQGVILYPMQYHNMYYKPFVVRIEVVQFAAIIVVGLVCVWLWQQKRGNFGVAAGVDAIRCAVGIATCLIIFTGFQRAHWLLAFLPLSLFPGVRSFSATELFPRLFLTSLTATELLVAYPVAGSQVQLVTSLHLLWDFLCVADGTRGLTVAWEQSSEKTGRKFHFGLVVSSVLLIAGAAKAVLKTTLRDLPPGSSLNGSSLLHLGVDQERDYEFLSRSIAANCSVLFTMPGMGSFNFWSGVATPDGSNVTGWMRLLDAERQRQILDRLQSTPAACVVYNPSLVALWQRSPEELMALPLAQYILNAMPKTATRGDYEIRVHPKREWPWRSPNS